MEDAIFGLLNQNAIPETLKFALERVEQEPADPNGFDILTLVAARAHDFKMAISAVQKAIALGGATPERLYNLALALQDSGSPAEAQVLYLRVIILQPNFALAFNNLGNIFLQQGLVEESIAALRSAMTIQPDWPDCRYGLAMAYRTAKRFVEAYATLHDLCAMNSPSLQHLLAAGNTALDIQEPAEAERHFRRALLVAPENVGVMNCLGVALARQDRFFDARDQFQSTLKLAPDHAEAHFGLACCLERLMEPAEADRHHQVALDINPQMSFIHSNRLMNLVYRHDITAATIFAAHQAWGETIPNPPVPRRSAGSSPPVKLGFVSPDFHFHSISMALPALLDHIDRKRFYLAAYAELKRPDAMTERYQRSFQKWVNTVDLPADIIANQIRHDGIDVLIDLAGHTARNRLDIFSMKPAPIQMSWLGYPGSTGLKTMDYRITDSVTDVPGQEALHTERLIRLDPCFLCLVVPADLPPVTVRKGQRKPVTFGSFNNLMKLNPELASLWSTILQQVPGSRLLLKDKGFADRRFTDHVYALFETCGIPRHRLDFRERLANPLHHWSLYHEIDIALDPFPYNGTITTFEALVMGVPVVTLLGDRHSARVSASLLKAIGAPELVASDALSYAALAVDLANDVSRMDGYRRVLREQVRHSDLCDGKAFAERFCNAVEQAISDL